VTIELRYYEIAVVVVLLLVALSTATRGQVMAVVLSVCGALLQSPFLVVMGVLTAYASAREPEDGGTSGGRPRNA